MSTKYFSDKTHVTGQNWFQLKTVADFSPTTCCRFCQQAQILSAPFGHETFSPFWRGKNNVLQFKKDHKCLQKTFSAWQIKEEMFQQSPILAALVHFNCCYSLSKKGRISSYTPNGALGMVTCAIKSKNSNVNDLFAGRGGVLTVL